MSDDAVRLLRLAVADHGRMHGNMPTCLCWVCQGYRYLHTIDAEAFARALWRASRWGADHGAVDGWRTPAGVYGEEPRISAAAVWRDMAIDNWRAGMAK